MGIRKYKPTTPGRRGSSVADFVELTRSTPRSRCSGRCPRRVAGTPPARSPLVTTVAVTSGLTA